MPESLDLIHVSGGLIGTAVLADVLSDAPRRHEFGAGSFALPGETAETPTGHAETVEAAWQLACERYDDVAADLDQIPVGRARDRWLLPLLELLDFAPVYQRAHLPSEDGRDRFAISHLGWQATAAPPIHLVASDLDDRAGRGQRTPHDEVQQYLNRARPLWGAVANSRRLRLVRDFHHLHLKAFVAFDLDAIFETRDFPAFRALYRLVHRSRFVPGEDGICPLERLFQVSQDQGVQIGQTLQRQVRKAIEALAEGLFDPELKGLLTDPKEGRALYREVLIVLYRLLFLLFAEQRRMLPADGLYAETYSVTTLARLAETRAADPRHHDLWEGLKLTFRMLSKGAPEIGVFPYDGQLFDLSLTPRVVAARCANRHLLDAIRALTRVRVGGVPQRVNYGELGVEELGSVYESLLNESLHVAERPTPIEDRMIPLGGVYLAPLGTERRDLGAYYTRPTLVDFALSVSIDPLIEERLAATGPEVAARERALLDLRICDPSCGSGAFLVGGIDRVALALATERAEGSKPTEDALRLARRDVLRHCIYGVDKDEFAVELCKVALWIHCAVPDLPLSFLDHRIQHGDSLVGWPLTGIPSTVSVEAYTVPSKIASSRQAGDRALAAFLRDAARRNQDWHQGQGILGQELPRLPDIRVDFPALLTEDERVPADVARKSEAYASYLRSPAYRRFKAAADLWTAAFFWGPEAGAEPPTGGDYLDALDGGADPAQAAAAAEILQEFPAFHWPIRFPEIRARGGFDAFVGNPPWEQVKPQEREWFATRAPEIAALPTARRGQAIEQLETTNPALYRRWRQTVTAYARLAEYARRSERYRASGHEPNTYLLFTELVANGLRRNGHAGMIIKSALALDKSASGLFRHLVDRI